MELLGARDARLRGFRLHPHRVDSMHAAAMRVDIRLFDVRSIKDKRATIKRIISQVKKTHGVSVAEVDYQELWQRCALGVAVAAADPGYADRVLQGVERDLRARPDIEVLSTAVRYLEDRL